MKRQLRPQLLGTGPPGVVRLRPGIKDPSILITHEDGRHGELPALVAVVLRKVQPLGPVNIPNGRLDREDQVQAPSIGVAGVAQQGKARLQFFGQRIHPIFGHRREGDDIRIPGTERLEGRAIVLQLQNAVASPRPPEEDQGQPTGSPSRFRRSYRGRKRRQKVPHPRRPAHHRIHVILKPPHDPPLFLGEARGRVRTEPIQLFLQ